MTADPSQARDPRLDHLQQALEEELQAIAAARNAVEAEAARHQARARLEALAFRHKAPSAKVGDR